LYLLANLCVSKQLSEVGSKPLLGQGFVMKICTLLICKMLYFLKEDKNGTEI